MTKGQHNFKEQFNRAYYFFPVQLLILHFKKNHLLIAFWFILFGIICNVIGSKFGVPILILAPEYLGKTGFAAYALLGFALGGFIMAFNLYSYIMHGFRFPFIASVSRPFFKFCINNFILPLLFGLVYFYQSYTFQVEKEFLSSWAAITNLLGFLTGVFIFFLLSLYYFFKTNRDVFNIHHSNKQRKVEEWSDSNLLQMASRWKSIQKNHRDWRIETYMSHPFKIALARKSEHYSDEVIDRVFAQNHINAAIFEILLIVSFVLIGSLREFKILLIPAGASFLLLFTMLIMIISASYSWFKGWTTTALLIIAVLINVASSRDSFLGIENKAYGVDYSIPPVDYKHYLDSGLPTPSEMRKDEQYIITMLENWKAKNVAKYGVEKPPIIFLNCSGGGLRSSLWSLRSMAYLDSITGGKAFDHTFLITGSSGGMVGISYYRALQLRAQQQGKTLDGMQYFDSLGQDMLNAIGVSLVTNDLFIRYQYFTYDGYRYVKDRAYAFEKELNLNTGYLMDKTVADYREDELKARIPMMILSPTIANDGRKILVSASPVSYLTKKTIPGISGKILAENISFEHLLRNHHPDRLKFTTALRMSSTFPYIMPATTLPTEPKLDIMDAGMRDNFGLTTTIPFISTFYKWIQENTSGIYVIQLRDLEKRARFDPNINTSFSARVVGPLGSVYSNIFNTQNYAQDEMEDQMRQWIKMPFDLITVELKQLENNPVSLSWHLTEFEKLFIKKGIEFPINKQPVDRIRGIFSVPTRIADTLR